MRLTTAKMLLACLSLAAASIGVTGRTADASLLTIHAVAKKEKAKAEPTGAPAPTPTPDPETQEEQDEDSD